MTCYVFITKVDFDYSTYNFRGYDLGRYFSNYRHVLDNMFSNEGFPSDEEMYLFLNEYQTECSKVQGKFYLEQEINSIEQLVKEVKGTQFTAYYFVTIF